MKQLVPGLVPLSGSLLERGIDLGTKSGEGDLFFSSEAPRCDISTRQTNLPYCLSLSESAPWPWLALRASEKWRKSQCRCVEQDTDTERFLRLD